MMYRTIGVVLVFLAPPANVLGETKISVPVQDLRPDSVIEVPASPGIAEAASKQSNSRPPAQQNPEKRQAIPVNSGSGLPAVYEARKRLILAKVELANNRSSNALQYLKGIRHDLSLNPDIWSEIWKLRSDIHARQQNYLLAAQSLIRRERYMMNEEAVLTNQQQTLGLLENMNPFEIREIRDLTTDTILAGWLELALINIEFSSDPYYLELEQQNWRRLYSGHPATAALIEEIAEIPPTVQTSAIRHIALLLPLASQFGEAAQAIYNGFMAMHQRNTDPKKPRVTLYDTGATLELTPVYYRQAVDEGADLVIGPLGKTAIEELTRSTSISVRTLLLGYATTKVLNPNAYQFGLLPEEEAEQVAERAWQDGKRVAGILYAENEWGQRMYAAFNKRWGELGGVLAEAQNFNPNEIDYSHRIKNLLNIDESISRKRKLTTLLKSNLNFQPRRRDDMDFIFVATHAKQGRLIKPQLNFYNAHTLPVYATSHIYTGSEDRIKDTDLNGIIFNDMPWLLKQEGKIATLRQTLDMENEDNGFHRFFALGIDAYQLAINFPQLQTRPEATVDGVTARLSIGENKNIKRKLLFAQFDKGIPKLLDNGFSGLTPNTESQ